LPAEYRNQRDAVDVVHEPHITEATAASGGLRRASL